MNKAWWVWLSWIETPDGQKKFIYGCMAQTHREDTDYVTDPVCSNGVYFSEKIIMDYKAADFFKTLNTSSIIGFPFLEEAPEVEFKNKRTVQKSALSHNNIPTDIFYSLPSLPNLFGDDFKEPFKQTLNVLKNELNFPFTKEYARYFGCFEVFHLHPWLDKEHPFLLDVDRSNKPGTRDTFYIFRDDEYSKKNHQAHVQFLASKEVIDEKLIHLNAGEKRSRPIELPFQADSYKYWIFDDEQAVDFDEQFFLSQVHINMSPRSSSIKIEDKLTERARNKDKDLGERAANVSSYSTLASNIDSRAHKDIRYYEANIERLCQEFFPEKSNDRFYNKSIENEVDVIQRLTKLISGHICHKAILVDPFFGADAIERLATRLESHDVKLSIITSWAKIDPDSGKGMNTVQDPQKMLQAVLPLIKPILNTPLRILNLQHKGDQAFHDRYLILYRHEGLPQVYLLSNSINKMAGNWPFCMSLLAPDTATQVQAYIEGLERGEDITGCTKPTISFQWSSKDE